MSPLVASAAMAKLPKEAAEKFKEITRRMMVIFHPDGYFNWVGGHSLLPNAAQNPVLTSGSA